MTYQALSYTTFPPAPPPNCLLCSSSVNRCFPFPLWVGSDILIRGNRKLSHGEAEDNFFLSPSQTLVEPYVLQVPLTAIPHTTQARCRPADWEKSRRKGD